MHADPPPPPPCRYIAASELSSVSSYMRGRLTADKVNAAIDELAGLAEGNTAVVAAARRNRAVGPDKKRAMWLAFHVAVNGRAARMPPKKTFCMRLAAVLPVLPSPLLSSFHP